MCISETRMELHGDIIYSFMIDFVELEREQESTGSKRVGIDRL